MSNTILHCDACKEFFPEKEARILRDDSTGQHLVTCPHCKSMGIEEAQVCEFCLDWVLDLDEDGLCAACHLLPEDER